MNVQFVKAIQARRDAAEARFMELECIGDQSKVGIIMARNALSDMEKWQDACKEAYEDLETTWSTLPVNEKKIEVEAVMRDMTGVADPMVWVATALELYNK